MTHSARPGSISKNINDLFKPDTDILVRDAASTQDGEGTMRRRHRRRITTERVLTWCIIAALLPLGMVYWQTYFPHYYPPYLHTFR